MIQKEGEDKTSEKIKNRGGFSGKTQGTECSLLSTAQKLSKTKIPNRPKPRRVSKLPRRDSLDSDDNSSWELTNFFKKSSKRAADAAENRNSDQECSPKSKRRKTDIPNRLSSLAYEADVKVLSQSVRTPAQEPQSPVLPVESLKSSLFLGGCSSTAKEETSLLEDQLDEFSNWVQNS